MTREVSKIGSKPMIFLFSLAMGPENDPHKGGSPMLWWLMLRWIHFKRWTVGGLWRSTQLAWRGDDTGAEWVIGWVLLGIGLWWAFTKQPAYSVFGAIERALPFDLALTGPLFGIPMALIGRRILHCLAYSDSRARMVGLRFASGAWLYLLLNQIYINPQGLGMMFFGLGLVGSVWSHEHIENVEKRKLKSSKSRSKTTSPDSCESVRAQFEDVDEKSKTGN